MARGEWGALLNGVYLSGGDGTQWDDVIGTSACSGLASTIIGGCLTAPPDGMGMPDLRTEDVTFVQRDGVKHFRDWYNARTITLQVTVAGNGSCEDCYSARQQVQAISQAWSRQCDDVELVIFTPCHGTEPPSGGTGALTGPYAVIGRPRSAPVTWRTVNGKQVATMTLRFDGVDQHLYMTDECGTPGTGSKCVTLTPTVTASCRNYPRCWPQCYDQSTGEGGGAATVTVPGTECAAVTITLCGLLTNPQVEVVETGQSFGYNGVIGATDACVIVNTADGTATQGGASRTHLLTGDPRLTLSPGQNTIRLTSFGANDDGTAELCYRGSVISG